MRTMDFFISDDGGVAVFPVNSPERVNTKKARELSFSLAILALVNRCESSNNRITQLICSDAKPIHTVLRPIHSPSFTFKIYQISYSWKEQ